MIIIRCESPEDSSVIHDVETKAFGRSLESDLVDALRKRGVITMSLVALESGQIVGHVLFSPVTFEGEKGLSPVVGLGPVAVLPQFQRKGIGSMLISAGLEECRKTGYEAVVVVGSRTYYQRFGFTTASHFGLRLEGGPPEAFMALVLRPGTLTGEHAVKYQPEFNSERSV